MKVQMISIDGKINDNIEISDKIFSIEPDKKIIRTVLDWQSNISKPRNAKTKQRNEVKGSTSKIYAQKGTGGARHSSKKAPLFVGGGVAHGPKGSVYKIKKINKNVKKLGLINALSNKIKNKSLVVVDDIEQKINKTKDFYKFLKKNNIKKVLLISDKKSKINIEKSARNIPNIKIIDQNGANVYDIIKYDHVLFTKSSIKDLEERLSK